MIGDTTTRGTDFKTAAPVGSLALATLTRATLTVKKTGQSIKFTMTEEREKKVLLVESSDALDGSQFRPIVVDLTVLFPVIDPNKAGEEVSVRSCLVPVVHTHACLIPSQR